MLVTAGALAATAAIAWRIAVAEGAHRVLAMWVTAMAAAQLGHGLAPASVGLSVAAASLGSLGLLGVCAWTFERPRLAWASWIAAALALHVAHPAVGEAPRETALRAVGLIAATSACIVVARALGRAREPRVTHLAVMIFAAAAVVGAVLPASPAAAGVPLGVAGVTALAAHVWWRGYGAHAETREEEAIDDASTVGDADVGVRGDERMGHLVDVAAEIRRRREREESARGGIGEA